MTIRTELAGRPPLTPRWLSRLGQTQIQRAVRASHALDDVDFLLVQGRVPARRGDFTCVVSLDLDRLGAVHGVVVEGPIEQALTLIDLPAADIRCQDVELADVRARLAATIELQTRLPPRESETWLRHRALVEWLIRLLPDGGSTLERPELVDPDVEALAREFFGSPQGAPFGRRHRDLFESLVEFGSGWGAGDPMRWNERRAGQWLFDRLLDDYHCEYLEGREAAPLLLRAFIRFAHDGVGIRPELSDVVLAAIESWEPEFQSELHRKLDEDAADWLPAAVGDE